jgi:hypothetical protein
VRAARLTLSAGGVTDYAPGLVFQLGNAEPRP